MGRASFKRTDQGFTLLELIIAGAISAVVLIAVSTLLINFGRFSSDVVRTETSLMGTALGTFEEIVRRIMVANEVAIPAVDLAFTTPNVPYPAGCAGNSCIQIRVSPENLAATGAHGNDTVFTYWRAGNNLMRRGVAGDPAAGRIIANNVASASFTRDGTNRNHIKVVMNAETAGGPVPGVTREHLETVAILRSRSAQA